MQTTKWLPWMLELPWIMHYNRFFWSIIINMFSTHAKYLRELLFFLLLNWCIKSGWIFFCKIWIPINFTETIKLFTFFNHLVHKDFFSIKQPDLTMFFNFAVSVLWYLITEPKIIHRNCLIICRFSYIHKNGPFKSIELAKKYEEF